MSRVVVALLLGFACPSGASPDFYGLLGVAAGASPKEISVAFRKLSLKYHPDKNPSNRKEAEVRMRELSAAYSVLSKAEDRRIYDAQRPKRPAPRPQQPANKTPASSDASSDTASSWSFAKFKKQQEAPSSASSWSFSKSKKQEAPSSDTVSSLSFKKRQEEAPSFWQTWSLARLFRTRQQQRPQSLPKAQPASAENHYHTRSD